MTSKDIKSLLIAVNSSENFFKYPIGNKELTEKLKQLESENKIKFNELTKTWEIKK